MDSNIVFWKKRLLFSCSIHFKWLHFNVGALTPRACQQDKVLFLGIPVNTCLWQNASLLRMVLCYHPAFSVNQVVPESIRSEYGTILCHLVSAKKKPRNCSDLYRQHVHEWTLKKQFVPSEIHTSIVKGINCLFLKFWVSIQHSHLRNCV